MKKFTIILLAVFSSVLLHAQNRKGLALVIGNSAYSEGALKNPVNDANDVSLKFRNLGFDVITKVDANLEQLGSSIDDFGAKAARYDVAIFYYSGHGIQYKGENYLIPVNARLRSEVDVRYYCENLNRVLAKLDESKCRLKILMLDACRNNPFERSWKRSSSATGLSSMDAPHGTIISYATAPGTTAADGAGNRNSPYTAAFIELLDKSDFSVLLLFNELNNIVRKNTGNIQNPWMSCSGIDGDFCFNVTTVGDKAIEENEVEELKEIIDFQNDITPNLVIKSSEEGNDESLVLLKKGADCYAKADYQQALRFFYQSAMLDNPEAQMMLGTCYYNGQGVKKDKEQGIVWLEKSALQGNADAMVTLAYHNVLLSVKWTGFGGKKYLKKALEYYFKAAELDNSTAQCVLGNFYFKGIGPVKKDVEQAVKWYMKSAGQGNIYAMSQLAKCYEKGKGVMKDSYLAQEWREKAEKSKDALSEVKYQWYTVKKGDTLMSIAGTAGVNLKAIMKLNGFTNKTELEVGQKIKIAKL